MYRINAEYVVHEDTIETRFCVALERLLLNAETATS
jgi:hypothetical protein